MFSDYETDTYMFPILQNWQNLAQLVDIPLSGSLEFQVITVQGAIIITSSKPIIRGIIISGN
jgi:hypothetical protein